MNSSATSEAVPNGWFALVTSYAWMGKWNGTKQVVIFRGFDQPLKNHESYKDAQIPRDHRVLQDRQVAQSGCGITTYIVCITASLLGEHEAMCWPCSAYTRHWACPGAGLAPASNTDM